MGVAQEWCCLMEHPIKMGDLGVAPFQETSIWLLKIGIQNRSILQLNGQAPRAPPDSTGE